MTNRRWPVQKMSIFEFADNHILVELLFGCWNNLYFQSSKLENEVRLNQNFKNDLNRKGKSEIIIWINLYRIEAKLPRGVKLFSAYMVLIFEIFPKNSPWIFWHTVWFDINYSKFDFKYKILPECIEKDDKLSSKIQNLIPVFRPNETYEICFRYFSSLSI